MAARLGGIAVTLCMCTLAHACGGDESPFLWERWLREIPSAEGVPLAIAVDEQGNSVVISISVGPDEVAGAFAGTTERLEVSHVRKVDPAGRDTWRADLKLEGRDARAIDLAMGDDGTIAVLGRFPTWFALLGEDGQIDTPPTAVAEVDYSSAIAIDDAGHVVLVGLVSAEDNDNDLVLVRAAPDGTVLWRRTHHGGIRDIGEAVAVGPGGEIVVGGQVGSDEFWLQKYDAEGNELWERPATYARSIAGDYAARGHFADVAIQPDGGIVAVGTIGDWSHAFGPAMAWAQMYDASGQPVWLRPLLMTSSAFQHPTHGELAEQVEFETRGYASAEAVAVGPDGAAVIVGFRSAMDFHSAEVWLHHTTNRGSDVRACARDRTECFDGPIVYQRGDEGPVHRSVAIDPEGHLIFAGEPIESELEGNDRFTGTWVGKLRSPTFPSLR